MNYSELCNLYQKLEQTPSRLEKTKITSEFLKSAQNLPQIMLLLQGRIFPAWDERTLGFSTQLIIKAIAASASISATAVEQKWQETGDLGTSAEQLITKKKQVLLFQQKLTIEKVFKNLQKIAEFDGNNSTDKKIATVVELLTQAEPLEAKYIARLILEDLRIGLGEGVLRDALVWAFLPGIKGITAEQSDSAKINEINNLNNYIPKESKTERDIYNYFVDQVQHALNMCNDFGIVAEKLKQDGLKGLQTLQLIPGNPVQSMLAQREKTIPGAFERVDRPAIIEYKLDGFRVQAHKSKTGIKLFTRRLENITHQFPDVVDLLNKHIKTSKDTDEYILDCEVIGIDPKTNRALPFQNISQRIKRKYNIKETIAQLPVAVYIFDILYHETISTINMPLNERRKLIEKLIQETDRIKPIPQIVTESDDTAQKFYEQSLAAGNEGVMFKKLDSIYQPGI